MSERVGYARRSLDKQDRTSQRETLLGLDALYDPADPMGKMFSNIWVPSPSSSRSGWTFPPRCESRRAGAYGAPPTKTMEFMRQLG